MSLVEQTAVKPTANPDVALQELQQLLDPQQRVEAALTFIQRCRRTVDDIASVVQVLETAFSLITTDARGKLELLLKIVKIFAESGADPRQLTSLAPDLLAEVAQQDPGYNSPEWSRDFLQYVLQVGDFDTAEQIAPTIDDEVFRAEAYIDLAEAKRQAELVYVHEVDAAFAIFTQSTLDPTPSVLETKLGLRLARLEPLTERSQQLLERVWRQAANHVSLNLRSVLELQRPILAFIWQHEGIEAAKDRISQLRMDWQRVNHQLWLVDQRTDRTQAVQEFQQARAMVDDMVARNALFSGHYLRSIAAREYSFGNVDAALTTYQAAFKLAHATPDGSERVEELLSVLESMHARIGQQQK